MEREIRFMDLNFYNQTLADIQHNANVVKDMLLSSLVEDGIISKDDSEKYVVVVHKNGLFGILLEKLWGSTDKIGFKILRLK